jgi:hypothetical protein
LIHRNIFHPDPIKRATKYIHKMQSFIQYRRIGRDIKAQISRDQEKGHIAPVMGNSRYNNLQESCNDGVQDVAHAFPVDNPYRRTSLSSDRIQTPDSDDLVPHLDGVVAQRRTTLKGEQSQVFVVGWTCDKDRNNPHNWTKAKRVGCTLLVAYIAFVCMAASSIDSAVAPQAAEEFGVSLVVESFATGTRVTQFRIENSLTLCSTIFAWLCCWIDYHWPVL